MKIFAKRKRKAVPPGSTPDSTAERTNFASDPVVEELLKLDPKEWNSKQRRMIKRYQQRKTEIQGDSPEGTEIGRNEKEKGDVVKEESVGESPAIDESDNDSTSGSDGSSKANSEENFESDSDESSAIKKEASDAVLTKVGSDAVEGKSANQAERDQAPLDTINSKETATSVQLNKDDEVYKLLEQLNSKAKRTLTRKLDREGASVLEEVRNEARKILGLSGDDNSSKKRSSEEEKEKDSNQTSQRKKKRKKEVDWSSLPAEERLRREEQRRKQKEAAERRARGEDKTPGYKHPLNSERRRANRRKPKWKNSSGVGGNVVKNEHNFSGYHMRKQTA